MIHGSLFSGIGGFDLAASWMNWVNAFHCEINPVLRRILRYHFPNAISYEDIKKTDFTVWRGLIDVLSGGFPCQPYLIAGERKGKDDERHLWPEFLRAIREIQPRIVLGENVRGLVNWNGGLVFHEVQTDLEAEGYEVIPFLLPSAGIGAPHERYRVFFIAYSNSSKRSERGVYEKKPETAGGYTSPLYTRKNWSAWEDFPIEPPLRSGNNGIPSGLDGITVPRWTDETIKAAGNAVVPQLIYQIFKSIQELEKLN